MSGKLKLTGKYNQRAVRMLATVTSILDRNGIISWLESGTLLGVVRENRLLPWDNDVDISIDVSDAGKLLAILNRFRLRGYYVRIKRYREAVGPYHQGDLRIVKIHNRRQLVAKGPVMVDIIIKAKSGDSYYWGVGEKNFVFKSVPARFYDALATINFNGRDYWIPRDYDDYLTYRFGEWRIPRRQWRYLHDDLAIINPG